MNAPGTPLDALCKCLRPTTPPTAAAPAPAATAADDEEPETERVYLAMPIKSSNDEPPAASRGGAKAGPTLLTTVAEDGVEDATGGGPAADHGQLPALTDVAGLEQPEAVLCVLGLVAKGETGLDAATNVQYAGAACKALRVMCRTQGHRERCVQLGTARIISNALEAMPGDKELTLQGLAAIVNLCSGELHPPRTVAVEAGAVAIAAAAVKRFDKDMDIGEMCCLLVQNLCYGDDAKALDRRKRAAADGAIELAVGVMVGFNQAPEVYDACVAALRLTVDRLPDLRQQAIAKGAQPDWVKPVSKDPSSGGLLSFRGLLGGGTSRSRARQQKVVESSSAASPPSNP